MPEPQGDSAGGSESQVAPGPLAGEERSAPPAVVHYWNGKVHSPEYPEPMCPGCRECLVPLRLLHGLYDALRSVEKYADRDMTGYDDCLRVKEELGEILWPAPITVPSSPRGAEWQRRIAGIYMSDEPVRFLPPPLYSRSVRLDQDAALMLMALLTGQKLRFIGHNAQEYEAEVLERLRKMTGSA